MSITQQELADRADLHRTYIADIERGGRNVSLINIAQIATALGSSLPEFFLEIAGKLPRGRRRT